MSDVRRSVFSRVALLVTAAGLLVGVLTVGAKARSAANADDPQLPIASLGATIASGLSHSAVVGSDGRVWTWGANQRGQLGREAGFGTTAITTVPEEVPGISTARAVAVSDDHTLVVLADGTVVAFGADAGGQLGATPSGAGGRWQPQTVPGLAGAVAVGAGRGFSAAVAADGSLWTFGVNNVGQLGRVDGVGTTGPQPTPAAVAGVADVKAVAAGSAHVLALRGDGTIWAFGSNLDGQLGIAATALSYAPQPTPAQVPLATSVAVAAGGSHSVVRLSDGTVQTFGLNRRGELGTTASLYWRTAQPQTPVGIASGSPISAGATHLVAVAPDGSIAIAGGSIKAFTATVVPVAVTRPLDQAVAAIVAVAAGPSNVLAVDAGGALFATGWITTALPGALNPVAGLSVMPTIPPTIVPPVVPVPVDPVPVDPVPVDPVPVDPVPVDPAPADPVVADGAGQPVGG